VLRVLSVQPLFARHLGIAPEAREQASLGAHRFVEQFKRLLVGQLERVHVRFSPAVGARQVALVNHGRHLHAVVAGDAVELAFVALAVTKQRLLGPMACFHATVLAHDVVALLLQFGFELRVHACHAAHSWSRVPRWTCAGWGRLG
jgi:hypothetical protein